MVIEIGRVNHVPPITFTDRLKAVTGSIATRESRASLNTFVLGAKQIEMSRKNINCSIVNIKLTSN